MSFSSYQFVFLFLPLTVFLFWIVQRKSVPAALWLLSFASLVFYVQWNPRDVVIAGMSVLFNYFAARKILQNSKNQKYVFIAAIATNLVVLGYFKYLGFIVQLVQMPLGSQAVELSKIVLPLGISFFTFTQIAYLADCYAKKIALREHNPRDYILFVSFFPHLIAGPILHHRSIIPQFHGEFQLQRRTKMTAGAVMFVIGLFKKVMIADHFSMIASPIFLEAGGHPLSSLTAWQGALAYTLQIYFDFSGYSDMAVGSALLVGMHIPFNFFSPYKATSIIEFWRRWHISLSTFLRDYLYVPLGGNRHGTLRRYLNVFITMVLGGIWHGAGMNFVIWGALHGAFIMVNHAWRDFFAARFTYQAFRVPGNILSHLLTMLAVVVAWVFFRADNVATATAMVRAMVMAPIDIFSYPALPSMTFEAMAIILGFACTSLLPNSRQMHDWIFQGSSRQIGVPIGFACGIATAFSIIFMSANSPFLYFNF